MSLKVQEGCVSIIGKKRSTLTPITVKIWIPGARLIIKVLERKKQTNRKTKVTYKVSEITRISYFLTSPLEEEKQWSSVSTF